MERVTNRSRFSLPAWAWVIVAVTALGILAAISNGKPSQYLFAVFMAAATAVYVLPWIIADWRGVTKRGTIIAVDLLLGWTVLGWIGALAMAVSGSTES